LITMVGRILLILLPFFSFPSFFFPIIYCGGVYGFGENSEIAKPLTNRFFFLFLLPFFFFFLISPHFAKTGRRKHSAGGAFPSPPPFFFFSIRFFFFPISLFLAAWKTAIADLTEYLRPEPGALCFFFFSSFSGSRAGLAFFLFLLPSPASRHHISFAKSKNATSWPFPPPLFFLFARLLSPSPPPMRKNVTKNGCLPFSLFFLPPDSSKIPMGQY